MKQDDEFFWWVRNISDSNYELILYIFQKFRKICSICDQGINGTFYEKDGKFICAEDYKVLKILILCIKK